MQPAIASRPNRRRTTIGRMLLIVPWIGLCFPQLYSRANPTLFGFPFFYWYQLLWVFLAAATMGIAYRLLRT